MTTPQTVSAYDIGDLVRAVATFVGTDGLTPADASTVTFYIKTPAGSVATYVHVGGAGGGSITRVGAGAYAKDFTVDAAGSWFYRVVGTGGVQAAEEWSLIGSRSFIL